jgi:hypothetical protein
VEQGACNGAAATAPVAIATAANPTAAAAAAATAASIAAAKADAANVALSARFNRLANEVAIVLMHEEDDVSSKSYMIEVGLVYVGIQLTHSAWKRAAPGFNPWAHEVRKTVSNLLSNG